MLELVNVRKTFNPRTVNEKIALDGVNLRLEDGDFVTVIGGNGAGKSTMLNAIAGVSAAVPGRRPDRSGDPDDPSPKGKRMMRYSIYNPGEQRSIEVCVR